MNKKLLGLAAAVLAAVILACGPNGGATPIFSGPPAVTPGPLSSGSQGPQLTPSAMFSTVP